MFDDRRRQDENSPCGSGALPVRIDSETSVRQAITRTQLRKIVPLGDTTIWEMEQRKEFPRRFFLTSRCVAWDLQEVQDWLRARKRASEEGRIQRAPSPDVGRRRARPVRR